MFCQDLEPGQEVVETTLSEMLKNPSYIPESPVTASYLNAESEEKNEVRTGTVNLYTADGFRHVYDYTVVSRGSAYYHYNAQKSQNVSEMFAWRRVDAAEMLDIEEVESEDIRQGNKDPVRFLIEISGYSFYQNGMYMGEIVPPCEREAANKTETPEPLIRKN